MQTQFSFFRVPWLLALALLCVTCKKEDPLPAATQTGANTFGCLINGKPYTPEGYICVFVCSAPPNLAAYYEDDRLSIGTYKLLKDDQGNRIFDESVSIAISSVSQSQLGGGGIALM